MAGKLMLAAALVLGASAFAAQDQFIKVELNGMLHSSARGGYSVDVNGTTFILDLGRNADFRRLADRHDNSLVSIKGFLFSEKSDRGNCPSFVVAPTDMDLVGRSEVTHPTERRIVEERPVYRERVIKEDAPIFKAGPLEINP